RGNGVGILQVHISLDFYIEISLQFISYLPYVNIMCVDALSLCQVVNLVNDCLHGGCYWLYMNNDISIRLCEHGTDLFSCFAFDRVAQFMNLLKRECPRSRNNDVCKELIPRTPYAHTPQFANFSDAFNTCAHTC